MTAIEFTYHIAKVSKSLKPFAMRLTKDSEDANDLLQDTLLKAFTNRDKYADGTNLKAWLYTIMKNTFITNYQRMVRKNTFIDTSDNLHYINSFENSTENEAAGKFAMDDINKAVNSLEEAYRTPFMMYYRGSNTTKLLTACAFPSERSKTEFTLRGKSSKTSYTFMRIHFE